MQNVLVNKTVFSMRLGLILAFSYAMLAFVCFNTLSSFASGDGNPSVLGLIAFYFFLIFPFVFIFRMTVNYCCSYNDFKYEFFVPFSISIKGFAFGGILYTLCFYLYLRNNPTILSDIANAYEKVMEGQGNDAMVAQVKEVLVSATPKSLIPTLYMDFLFMGVFVSLISVGAAKFARIKKPVDAQSSFNNEKPHYDKAESNENKDN